MIKNCQTCSTKFDGRRDAKTCSVKCRKRLQRAKTAILHEAGVLKQDAEQVINTLKGEIIPVNLLPAPAVVEEAVTEESLGLPDDNQSFEDSNWPSEYLDLASAADFANPPTTQPIAGIGSARPGLGTGVAVPLAPLPASAQPPVSANEQLARTVQLSPQLPVQPEPTILSLENTASSASPLSSAPISTLASPTLSSGASLPTPPTPAAPLGLRPSASFNYSTPPRLDLRTRLQALLRNAPSTAVMAVLTIVMLIGGVFAASRLVYQSSKSMPVANTQTGGPLEADASGILTLNPDTILAKGKTLTVSQIIAGPDSLILQVTGDVQSSSTLYASNGQSSLNNSGLTINNVVVCTANGCTTGATVTLASTLTGEVNLFNLPAEVTIQGNNFNGLSQLVRLTAGGILPVLSGANLTNLAFSSVASGTNVGALVIGSGGSLSASGTGIITATDVACANCITLGGETSGDYVASFTAGDGLIGNAIGSGSTPTLNVASANGGIIANADNLALTLTTSGTTGATSSNSGLEILAGGLTLLKGCTSGSTDILKWNGTVWACAADATTGGSTPDFDAVYAQSITNANLNMEIDDTGGLTFDLTTTGDFAIRDGTTAFATFDDSGGITFAPNGTSGFIINQAAGVNTQITATAAPTVDMVSITNSGQASTTDGIDGLAITFGTSNASGDALRITPSFAGGATDGRAYNGIELDAFSPTNASGTDFVTGLRIGTLTDPGSTINSKGLYIAAGWDTGINVTGSTDTNIYVDSTSTQANGILVSSGSGAAFVVSYSSAPVTDMVSISNSAYPTTTLSGVDGIELAFSASNASGDALHIIPYFAGGTFDTRTYNGIELDGFSPTNAAGTDTVNGINIGALTDPGATITSTALRIGSGWDTGISIIGASTSLSASGGSIIQTSTGPNVYMGGADASGSTNSGTGNKFFQSVYVSGRYEYVGTSGSATACSQTAGSAVGCELQVYDISNPATPTYVGGADASGSTNSGTGAGSFYSVYVSGHYAYVAGFGNATACSQTAGSAIGCELQVYDISNPVAPTYVGGADASGSTNSGTGNVNLSFINISGRYAYVGTIGNNTACSQTAGSAIGCELQVYDISNPAAPAYVGGADASGTTNSGTNANNFSYVYVSGRYAYVNISGAANACSQTAGSAVGCELQVYDISNPAAPAYVGGADASGSTNSGTGNNSFNSVYVSGRYAYVAVNYNSTACSQTAGSAIGCELQVYDISNPAAPAYVGGADASGSTNSGTGNFVAFRAVYTSGRYAYVGTGGTSTACSQTVGSAIGCELQVYDISNPAAPTYVGGADSSGSINSGTGSRSFVSVYVSGRYAHVGTNGTSTACSQTTGSATGCELQIYDVTGVEATTVNTGSLTTGSLQVYDNALFNNQLGVTGGLSVGIGGLYSQGALSVGFGSAPGADLASITNAGFGTTTAAADGLQINFTTAAVAGSVDNAGLRLVIDPAGATEAGDTVEAIDIANITNPTGVTTAINIGTGWDLGLAIAGNPAATATSAFIQLANGLTSGNAGGTFIAANAITGFTGDFFNFQLNGAARAKLDSTGALTVVSCTGCGGGVAALDTLTAATTDDAAILSGDNTIIWEWALSSAASRGMTIGESAASTLGAGDQFLLELTTDATSTAGPLSIVSNSADAGDVEINLNSAGDFVIQNNGTPVLTVDDAGNIFNSPSSPSAVSGVDLADTNDGNGVFVSGRYAYVVKGATGATCSGATVSGCEFTIIDISNPSSPSAVSGVDLSNAGWSVFVSGRYAYVVKNNNAGTCSGATVTGCELIIIDVSNPSSPSAVSGVDLADSVYGVFVSGRYAYVAKNGNAGTCSGATVTGCEFTIIDVSNPAAPSAVAGIDLADSDGNGVFVSGRYAYVAKNNNAGTCSGATVTGCEFTIIDISNPSSPSVVSGVDLADNTGWSVFVSGRYAYVGKALNTGTCSGATVTGCEFTIIDISNPSSLSAISGVDLADHAGRSVFVSGRYAYVGRATVVGAGTCSGAIVTGCELIVIDVSNPSSPSAISGVDLADSAGIGVFVSGRYAYVAKTNDAGTCSGATVTGCEFTIVDLSGAELGTAMIHSLETGGLQVRENALFNNQVSIAGGLTVGWGLQVTGDLGLNGRATIVTNSTTAFQIQNASGLQIFNVDTTVDSANLVTNGSLEVDTTGWTARGSSTLSRTTSSPTPYLGLGQLKVVTTAAANDGAKYAYALASTTQYSLTAFARLDSGSAAMATFEIGRADNGSTDTSCLTAQTVTTTGWTRFTCTFTTGTTSGSPYVYFKQTDATAHTFYLDTVKLEAAAAATPYREGALSFNGIISSPSTFKNQSDSTTAFQIQNAAGTSNLFNADTTNDRIGIGTTGPEAKVQISGGGLCVGSDANCNTDNNTEGVIYSSSTSMTVYDVAENYPTKDTSLAPGEVVALDKNLNGPFVKRAQQGEVLLGAISEKPGVLLGGFNGQQYKGEHQVPVALSGRIDIKVSTENGAIVQGDPLTISSTAGVAMKATKAGTIIGVALEGYNGTGEGRVMTFVKTGYYNGSNLRTILESAQAGPIDNNQIGKTALSYFMSHADTTDTLDVSEITTDRLAAGLEIISPKVTTDQVALNSIEAATGANINVRLSDDGRFVVTNPAGEEVISFDSQGNAKFTGTVTADKLKANQIEGLEILTDKISSLSAQLSAGSTDSQSPSAAVGGTSFTNNVSFQSITVALDLNVMGSLLASGGLVVQGDASFLGNVGFGGHLSTNGDQTAIITEVGAGITIAPVDNPGAVLATATVDGNDISGQMTVKLGDNASAGKLTTLTFKKPYSKSPRILITPTNESAAGVQYYVTTAANGFTITATDGALTPGASLTFNYLIVE